MTKRLASFLCAAVSVAAIGMAAAPQSSFGACVRVTPSSLFHYSTQSLCEYRPLPGVFEMEFPFGGEWILSGVSVWWSGGSLVTASIALKEKTTKGTYVIKGEVGSGKI